MIEAAAHGGLSGLLATVPMTAAMKLMHRRLPWHEREDLPPRQITVRIARRLGLARHLNEPQRKAATYASHFGYGTMVGSLYGLLCRQGVSANVSTGMLYGLLVWAGSYLHLLPALGIMAPATRHPPRRTALMIVAHLIWGGALGLLVQLIQPGTRSQR
jgi:uncharacterized membrane protein YagU involved in acid resistance